MSRVRPGLRTPTLIAAAVLLLAFSLGVAETTLRSPLTPLPVAFDQLPGWTPLVPAMRDADVLLMAYTVDPEVGMLGPARYGVTRDRRLVTMPEASVVDGLETSERSSTGTRFTTRPVAPAGTDLVAVEGDGTSCVISRWVGTSIITDVAVSEEGMRTLLNGCHTG